MVIAVDTGGTKTLVALFSDTGEIIKSEKIPTNPDLDTFLSELTSFIEEKFWSDKVKQIVMAVPGVVNLETQEVFRFGNLPWENVPFGHLMSQKFNVPITIENDAKVAAFSEARLLESAAPLVLYLTIGTGIGTGLVFKGEPDLALNRSEAGKLILWHDGSYQAWEDIASGRAILRDYKKYAHDIHEDATWKEIAHKLSLGLLAIIPTFYPDVIIFGGSIGAYFESYSRYVSEEVSSHLAPIVKMPRLLKAHHPEEAVIYGCYEIATNNPHPHSHSS
ncbi:MAG TPA: ROK family protein [Candidatus Saccharimonadales bacterium]|nr:ROK family protein [Candidatus Saccharimonadales bacterium]